MNTSQKHRNFVAEPMGEKPVTELAGVGEVLGKRLIAAGFDKVRKNYNQVCCAIIVYFVGVCSFGTVSGTEEKSRIISRMDERYLSG